MESESRDQQPVEEAQAQEEPAEVVEAGQPIYEFPPESRIAQLPASQPVSPEAGMPLEEAVRRGLIYPPPPAYYQNMPEGGQRVPLPPVWSQPPVPGGSVSPTAAPYGYQAGTQTLPPPAPAQPAQKPSRTWIWVVATFFSVIVLLSCGLCSWGFYSVFTSSFQITNGVITTVNDYYSAIEQKNYVAAYSELAPQGSISGLTQEAFIQQARQRDLQYGPVTSYAPGQPAFGFNSSNQPDLSQMTLTVSVTRTHLHYTVLLTLQKTGNNWRITDFDRI
jgi:predicted small integral membrane protein